MYPSEIHSYLGRVLYARRGKMDPFWNEIVVAGHRDGNRFGCSESFVFQTFDSFLGAVDLHGTVFQEQFICTGMALHLGIAILRKDWHPDMTEEECTKVLEDCMRVMFYRNTQSSSTVI